MFSINTFINEYSENRSLHQYHQYFFERQLLKKNDDILQYDSQFENQIDNQNDIQIDIQVDIQVEIQIEIQVDTQIIKQNDKRETIDDDNKRDITQKNARIIEVNVVKNFHYDVYINLITKRFSINAKNRFQCRHQ